MITQNDIDSILELETLVGNFDRNIVAIQKFFKGRDVTRNIGTHYIYADVTTPYSRMRRMLLYDIMLHESANLKTDWITSYYLLKEAYIMTDNIHEQLKMSQYKFDLKGYMREMQQHVNIDELMDAEEMEYLQSLSFPLKVYRGMCNAEYASGEYGISWTDKQETAEKYVFYSKNNNYDSVGKIADATINRSDIFAAWGVKGKEKELIILVF